MTDVLEACIESYISVITRLDRVIHLLHETPMSDFDWEMKEDAAAFVSGSQRARVWTEGWVLRQCIARPAARNLYWIISIINPSLIFIAVFAPKILNLNRPKENLERKSPMGHTPQ